MHSKTVRIRYKYKVHKVQMQVLPFYQQMILTDNLNHISLFLNEKKRFVIFGQHLEIPAIVKHSAKPVLTAITQWLDLVFLEQTHKFYAPLYLPSISIYASIIYLFQFIHAISY